MKSIIQPSSTINQNYNYTKVFIICSQICEMNKALQQGMCGTFLTSNIMLLYIIFKCIHFCNLVLCWLFFFYQHFKTIANSGPYRSKILLYISFKNSVKGNSEKDYLTYLWHIKSLYKGMLLLKGNDAYITLDPRAIWRRKEIDEELKEKYGKGK